MDERRKGEASTPIMLDDSKPDDNDDEEIAVDKRKRGDHVMIS